MAKEKKQHVVWSSSIELEDWKDFLEEEGIEDKYEAHERVTELNYEYLEDEKANLDIPLKNGYTVLGDLGFWNGRQRATKSIEQAASVKDCLKFEEDCDDAEWYVDEAGDLRSTQSHHDGTHHLRYRAWKAKLSKAQKKAFCELFHNGWLTEQDVQKYTTSIGEKVAKVYGWVLEKKTK